MLKHLVNLLKGEVTGRVESGFPERVLNLCAEYGIVFWDLSWESQVAFTFTMTRRDWKRHPAPLRAVGHAGGLHSGAVHGVLLYMGLRDRGE